MYEAALSLALSILFLNNFPYIQVGFNFVFFDKLSSYFRLLNILYVLLKKFTVAVHSQVCHAIPLFLGCQCFH